MARCHGKEAVPVATGYKWWGVICGCGRVSMVTRVRIFYDSLNVRQYGGSFGGIEQRSV